MKKWLCLLALVAAALVFPGEGTDIGELLPVELVSLTVEQGEIVARTDTGNFGIGKTLSDAMEDLKAGAPGKVFLETADYLLLAPQTEENWNGLNDWFRPGTLIFGVGENVNPEEAAAFLRSHTGGVPLNRLGKLKMEKVIYSEGRVKLEE